MARPIVIIIISLLRAKAPKTPSSEKDASINSKYIKLIKQEQPKAFFVLQQDFSFLPSRFSSL